MTLSTFTPRLAAVAAAALLGGCSLSSYIPFFGDDEEAPVTATSGTPEAATNNAPVYEVNVPADGVAAQSHHVMEGGATQPQALEPATAAQPYAPINTHAQPQVQPQPTLPADHQVAATGVHTAPAATPAAAAPQGGATLLPGRFYVRAGAFAQTGNADRAEAAMRNAGLPVYRYTIQGRAGTLNALRLGPYNSPDQARAAQAKVRALPLKIDTNIFQHRP